MPTKKKVAKKPVKKRLSTGRLGNIPLAGGNHSFRVKRTANKFIFGCGSVVLTHKQVELFLKELKRMRDTSTEQQQVFNDVSNKIAANRIPGGTNYMDPDKLRRFFFRKSTLKS